MTGRWLRDHFEDIQLKFLLMANLIVLPFYFEILSMRYRHTGYENWFIVPFSCLLLGMIFYGKWTSNRYLWLLNTVFIACLIIPAWHTLSNFVYLIFYVNLGLILVLFLDRERWQLQFERICRLLIGGVFLIAFIQKCTHPQFISGNYFYYEWYNNMIYSSFLVNMGMEHQEAIFVQHWDQLLHGLISNQQAIELTLPVDDELHLLSRVMTVLALVIEMMIGLLFLLPRRFKLARLRNLALLLFLFTTYFIVPVMGFAFILAALGFNQALHNKAAARWYFIAGVYVLVITSFRLVQIKDLSVKVVGLIS